MFLLVAQDETYTVRWKDEREAGLLHLVLQTREWPWVEFIFFLLGKMTTDWYKQAATGSLGTHF